MNFSQARVRLVQAGAVFAAAALVAGCGNNYRPVVTPVNPSGPAPQPQSLAVVVSAPSPTTPGIATVIDYAGDSILATAPIGPGPTAFTLDETGYNGYTINSDDTMTNIPVSTTLQTKNISIHHAAQHGEALEPVLAIGRALGCGSVCNHAPSSMCENATDVFIGSPETFLLSIPLAPTPVMVVGPGIHGHTFLCLEPEHCRVPPDWSATTRPQPSPSASVTGIEISNYTTDTPIPVGKCPVYAVESSDSREALRASTGAATPLR